MKIKSEPGRRDDEAPHTGKEQSNVFIRLPARNAKKFRRLCNAIQLAFLHYPLVRFTRALNPILKIIAFRRQQLHDLIDTVGATTAEGSRHETYRLADFEFVILHRASVTVPALPAAFAAGQEPS
jgi:hypothetical protein